MKAKTKIVTLLLILISALFLAGCDYKVGEPVYPVYPADKVFPNVPDGTYHFQTAIASCKSWTSNDGHHSLSMPSNNQDFIYLDGYPYKYKVGYTNRPMIVEVQLYEPETPIFLQFELTHAYNQSIKIIDSNIVELEQEYKGNLYQN